MQYGNLIFIVVLIAGFYFLLIRPQQQQAKRQGELIDSLEPGDEILTIGGIYGRIVEVLDDRLRIRVADGSELFIARRAISSKVQPGHVDGGDAGSADDADEFDDSSEFEPEHGNADEHGEDAASHE